MASILPAPPVTTPGLAAVLPSAIAAMTSTRGPIALPAARSVAVVLVDGLGALQLRAAGGHARTLSTSMRSIRTVFPSTTVAALASLTTGVSPGEHGMVGYRGFDPTRRAVVEQLSGWHGVPDPATWQRTPTLFERMPAGLEPVVVGPSQYRDSSFSEAVLRGARYVGVDGLEERFDVALDEQRRARALVYLYVPELDQAGHRHGVDSAQWLAVLEALDAAVAAYRRRLPPDVIAVVTADHGMVDVPHSAHLRYDEDDALVDGVVAVSGEPRGLQLHLAPGTTTADRAALVGRWRAAYGEVAWVLDRDELVDGGYLGTVADEVRPRIGDVIVAARKRVAFYDERGARTATMIGQHGSFTDDESLVPFVVVQRAS